MIKPITPNDVGKEQLKIIPEFVIDSFNKLIATNFDGYVSRVKQDDVVDLIKSTAGFTAVVLKDKTLDSFDNKWLNVETIYEDAGWKVTYEKPGYNEFGSAFFYFKPKEGKK